nr:hypothetical protein [uncultured bacterium]
MVPRQRDAQTPRIALPDTITDPRRQPDARWRTRVRAWWSAIAATHWVMGARAAWELTRRARGAPSGLGRTPSQCWSGGVHWRPGAWCVRPRAPTG